MNIEKYESITGLTVPDSQQSFVTAQLSRAQSQLETMLGYTLDRNKVLENQYSEVGKSPTDCIFGWNDIDLDSLLPPDPVVGAYRLFNYNKKDRYLVVDPFVKLNSVKLVLLRPGDEPNGVTVQTLDEDHIRVHKKQGISKYIERCDSCFCPVNCDHCVQLAVDADWMFEDCLPNDLLYLWTDQVTYQVDCKKDIKRETLGPHSYERFDREQPFYLKDSQAVLMKYTGPNGSLSYDITI